MESARRGSAASSVLLLQEENDMSELRPSTSGQTQKHDILADLSKLQAEIDAMRNQSEKEKERIT